MKKVLLSITLVATLMLTGCASMGSYYGAPSASDTISTAKMKYKEVHEQGIAWQKTKAKIKKAEKLLKKANVSKDKAEVAKLKKAAIALANEAIYEADQAMIQSKEADKTWRNAVPQ